MNTSVLSAGEGRSVWVVGDRYTFLATGEDTGGAYALIHAQAPPGGGPPPHIHRREDEAFYVLDGQVAFQADGRNVAAASGTWITLPRGSLHAFKNCGAMPARMLILVNPSGLEKFFEEVGCSSREESTAPAAMERLLAMAPKYGLEMHLSPQGTQT